MKTLAKLAKQKTFSRNDILIILHLLSLQLDPSGFSQTLDMKEDLGFDRDADPE